MGAANKTQAQAEGHRIVSHKKLATGQGIGTTQKK